jgi:prepilin-type N-terminal cleavage/methylation domain-containing protein
MKLRPLVRTAFTLIELLVVISIIAILASVAMPVYSSATRTARMNAAMNHGRSIALSLRLFAEDNGGVFPAGQNAWSEPIVTANDAFRSLLPTYCDNEVIFAVPNSKTGPKADGRIDSPAQILARGENHWAYVAGLSTTSNSTWPLVVDHTDGSGQYSTDETALGGLWRGTHALVIRTDGSAGKVPLLGAGPKRYLPRLEDKSQNALQVADYMGKGARLLEPAQ